MATWMQTDAARLACRRRKWLSEPRNGWVKNGLGFRQFSLRGLVKVKAECESSVPRCICAAGQR
jgi:hypothetical protein